MFSRGNLLIVAVAVLGAAIGLLAGQWLGPARGPSPSAPAGAPMLAVGDAATPATLPDLAGQPQSLTGWAGKLVLVNFWASWCAPCREEMPLLDRTQQRHAANGLQIVGISADSVAATRAFLDQFPVTYPILVDDPALGGDVSRDYGNRMNVLPFTVLIGRDGRILAQRAGNFSETSLEEWLAPHL